MAALLIAAPGASAQDFTDVKNCTGPGYLERCETLLELPAGVPGLVTGITPSPLCLYPLKLPVEGVGEIATCQTSPGEVTQLSLKALDEEIAVDSAHWGRGFEIALRNGATWDEDRTRIVIATGRR